MRKNGKGVYIFSPEKYLADNLLLRVNETIMQIWMNGIIYMMTFPMKYARITHHMNHPHNWEQIPRASSDPHTLAVLASNREKKGYLRTKVVRLCE